MLLYRGERATFISPKLLVCESEKVYERDLSVNWERYRGAILASNNFPEN